MSAVDLVATALPDAEPPEEPVTGICCVTGGVCLTLPRRLAIKPSFTDGSLLRAPHSDRVGLDTWRVLDYRQPNPGKKRDRFPLRQSSWLCDGETLTLLTRQGVREHVLAGVNADQWAGYVTTSYKKHGVLRARVNTNGRQVWLWEMVLVDCTDWTAVSQTWGRLREAQDAGIPRPLIESLDISPDYMGKIGWRIWREFETWARPRMRAPLYRFMTYLLPSKVELTAMMEEECESA